MSKVKMDKRTSKETTDVFESYMYLLPAFRAFALKVQEQFGEGEQGHDAVMDWAYKNDLDPDDHDVFAWALYFYDSNSKEGSV